MKRIIPLRLGINSLYLNYVVKQSTKFHAKILGRLTHTVFSYMKRFNVGIFMGLRSVHIRQLMISADKYASRPFFFKLTSRAIKLILRLGDNDTFRTKRLC